MCGSSATDDTARRIQPGPAGGVGQILDLDDMAELATVASGIARQDEVRRTAAGFVGYGATKPGDRVLIGVDSQTEPAAD